VLDLWHQSNIALDSEVGEQTDFLNHVCNRPAEANHNPIFVAASVEEYFTLAGNEQAVDEFQGGGLTRAAAAEQNECFSPLNVEREMVEQGLATIEMVGNIAELDCVLSDQRAPPSALQAGSGQEEDSSICTVGCRR
jgi:hypothetical protein